jgi:hypothetical protein
MTQRDRILQYLKEGKKLTRLNSWDQLGIFEAPARICELRQAGHEIKTKLVTVTNRYGDAVTVAEWTMEAA